MDRNQLLYRVYGYSAFRPGQEKLIDAVLAGKDVFGIMPTGGGKSVCYQIPALMLPGISLVISPLISLMQDQVAALKAAGVPAAYINSTLTGPQVQTVYRNLLAGKYKIVYVAPERLDYEGFGSLVQKLHISFLAVDEAHCISQWGQDFRPSYLRIVQFINSLPYRPVVGAYTATATDQVRKDVERILMLKQPVRVVTGFDRPNLYFDVIHPELKDRELKRLLTERRGKSGIIYCSTRKKVETVCENLRDLGYAATRYHAGLEEEERRRNQEDFLYDRKTIMVATNAFGMGIDKSNVSFVIHYNMPKSIEAYYQEAGRAGRDGKTAYAVLVYNRQDISRLNQMVDLSFPPLDYVEDIYQKIHIFYEIPYEHGEGRELKFHLEDFCRQFSLQRAKTHYAVQYLDRIGQISYSEDVEIPTRVKIIPDRQALYSIELPNPQMVSLLELLMRNYTGIFSYAVPVDEQSLGRSLGLSVPQLRVLLYETSLEHVIKYIPCDVSTVVFLRHPRLRPGDVDLKPLYYKRLREAAQERAAQMEQYCTSTDECRSARLIRYFGQEEVRDCGVCDVCRARKGRARTIIREWMGEHPDWTEQELFDFLKDPASGLSPSDVEIARDLIDSTL